MANFNLVKPTLLQIEGGYQNKSSDSGNYNSLKQLVGTNHGISAPVYESWIGRVPSIADMKNMSKETSLVILKSLYWDKLKGDEIKEQAIAEMLFDHAINRGVGTTVIMLQTLLKQQFNKSLKVDGGLGNITLSTLNSVYWKDLFYQISRYRKLDYEKLNNPEWLSIWYNRIKIIASKYQIDVSKIFKENSNTFIAIGGLLLFSTLAYMLINNPTNLN